MEILTDFLNHANVQVLARAGKPLRWKPITHADWQAYRCDANYGPNALRDVR
jgi:hypothetical protein